MSRKVRLALVAIVIVAIIAFSWFVLLDPLRSDIAVTDTEIEKAQEELAVAQAKLAQAEVTKAEGKKNQVRLIELAKMVPQSEEVASLLIQIQDLASQAGVEFMSITPGAPTDSLGYRVIPLGLTFSGTFFNLNDFIYRAEQMVAGPGRLLALKQIALQPEQDSADEATGSPRLDVSMTLYAFDLALEAPLPTPANPSSDSSTSESTT